MPSHRTVIHWFRRDLRLTDHPALHWASQSAERIIPAYVLSGWKGSHDWTGSARQQFLSGCLAALAKNLEAAGSRLIIRCGEAAAELERLARETGANAITFHRCCEPAGREMEKRVRQMCLRLGIKCRDFKDAVLHEPGEALTGEGNPFRVFTPYFRRWVSLPKDKPQLKIGKLGRGPDASLPSLPVPSSSHWRLEAAASPTPEPGERAARERMRSFIADGTLSRYDARRDVPTGRTTSRLSQDLRFGLISIRELHHRILEAAGDPACQFIKELAWREFYAAILFHFPEVFETEFNPEFRDMPWPGTDESFERWSQGRTGFPIVDAGIRQLLATGFMHNRLRMITAMFLTKDLHCHWRLGERFFMRHLVDGESASNNGGWQWSAGTGADAAPYFRVQNPWTQTKRHDPRGEFIKRWVPELAGVPADRFHLPPADGRPIAEGYCLPMVDHSAERLRCLARFARHRAAR